MIDNKQFTESSKAAFEQFFDFSGQAFQGVEQLTALNMQAAKTLLAEFSEGTQAAMSASNPEELIKLQTAALKSAPEKSAAYAQQVKAIFDASFASQRAVFEAKLAEGQTQFVASVATMLKDAPGSENTLALVKSAVAASNNAFEGANKAGKQVADAVEANVAKFTETASKAGRSLTAA